VRAICVNELEVRLSHTGVAFGFEDARLKNNIIVPVALCGNELQAEADRIENFRMIDVGPLAESPYYYDTLIVLGFYSVSSREINNLKCVPITSDNSRNYGGCIIGLGKLGVVGDLFFEIFH